MPDVRRNRSAGLLSLFVLALISSAAPKVPAGGQDQSPRLATLKSELGRGNRAALDAFWKSAASGAPLVEPNDADRSSSLVTFLWRGGDEIQRVVVVGYALGADRSLNLLERLAGTDVWYRTRSLPSDLRMIYGFAVNPPWPSLGPMTSWRPDPLNPRTFLYPKDPDSAESMDFAASLLELPQAAPQPWIVKTPGRPEGGVERFRVKSDILKNERRVFVYTPPGYETGRGPYGLLLVFDGWAYASLVPTPTILDNLIAEKALPPLVAVLIDNPDAETRNRELGCSERIAEFLAREILPWVRARYAVTADPAHIVVAGSSAGGGAAVCAAVRHPELIGNVLAQSGAYFDDPEGPLGNEWIFRTLVKTPKMPLRFYLDVGRYEPLFSVNASRHLRNVLEAKGYAVTYAEFSGGHDYSQWRGTFADGLIALTRR